MRLASRTATPFARSLRLLLHATDAARRRRRNDAFGRLGEAARLISGARERCFWIGGKEVDLVEEFAGGLRAFEIKWSSQKAAKPLPGAFRENYPNAVCIGIAPDRYAEYLA